MMFELEPELEPEFEFAPELGPEPEPDAWFAASTEFAAAVAIPVVRSVDATSRSIDDTSAQFLSAGGAMNLNLNLNLRLMLMAMRWLRVRRTAGARRTVGFSV